MLVSYSIARSCCEFGNIFLEIRARNATRGYRKGGVTQNWMSVAWNTKIKLDAPYLFFYPWENFNQYISRIVSFSILHTYPNLKIDIFKNWAKIEHFSAAGGRNPKS
jgi:hypothetical protein